MAKPGELALPDGYPVFLGELKKAGPDFPAADPAKGQHGLTAALLDDRQ